MNWSAQRIAFIGTGQMAMALAAGFVRQLLKPSQISGYDPIEASRVTFAAKTGEGVQLSDSLAQAISGATVVILAVKPQVMDEALRSVAEALRSGTGAGPLVVSIAAGIPIERLEQGLPPKTRVIRVMPNTPCLIGRGASGLAQGSAATSDDAALISELLATVGIVETVPESLLDAVTGLSGSGPAYVFQMIEALSDGGVKMGLPRAIATRLAAQTLAGAADMLLSTGQHPGALKDAVTSPGGTTIAGLHAMEQGGVRAALIDAVEASTLRSRELGRSARST
ncbi:MAG: pyrroline-5-carboxylate reductase [Planctomycetaceae bacterium]|nr:pyrroline-5-carboxylate reductase [Planctomycetaceae bacterium]